MVRVRHATTGLVHTHTGAVLCVGVQAVAVQVFDVLRAQLDALFVDQIDFLNFMQSEAQQVTQSHGHTQ